MTDYTPAQLEALNRAIAESEGLFDETTGQYSKSPLYTRDLNAIVGVVQRFCEKDMPNRALLSCELGYPTVGLFLASKQPALALCLAFAQAAGLEWEKV